MSLSLTYLVSNILFHFKFGILISKCNN